MEGPGLQFMLYTVSMQTYDRCFSSAVRRRLRRNAPLTTTMRLSGCCHDDPDAPPRVAPLREYEGLPHYQVDPRYRAGMLRSENNLLKDNVS